MKKCQQLDTPDNMFVYLKYEKGIKRVVDVTLYNCSRPKCRHVIEDRIDPALWYKVLILDSILVDCDKRCVFWNRETLQEAEYIHKCQEGQLNVDMVWSFFKDRERIFKEGEFYDYDPTIDELFDTAVKVFQKLGWDSIDKDGNSTAYENLLKMLHVFILPRIKFSQKDRTGVEVVLKWIEKHHEDVEIEIQKKDKTKKNTENGLHEQRKRLLEDGQFSKVSYVATCDPDFLNVFLPHLEKFIRKCNEDLVDFDRRITPIRDSLTAEDVSRLEQLRAERDKLYDMLQKAMIAREEIKNVVARKHVKKKLKKPKKAGHGSFQHLYVEISKRVQKISDEIQDLIKTKIKISSVREAVLLTVKEIDRHGYSYGYDFCRRGPGHTEIDIFDPNHKPEEWTTLPEKVTMHLQVKQAGFRSEHEKFCQRIKLRCQQLYDEAKLFSFPTYDTENEMDHSQTEVKEPLSPDTGNFLKVVGTESRYRRSTAPISDEPLSEPMPFAAIGPAETNGYTSRWSIGSVSKEKCQSICVEITDHIYDMAYKLAKELYQGDTGPSTAFVNKVYVCYEEHVSLELIPLLNELYEQSYRDHCQGLSEWLSSIPVSEVCGGELKILNLLHSSSDSPTSSSEESSRECSSNYDEETCVKVPVKVESKSATLGSRDIRDVSLEELYDIFNQQCGDWPMSFVGAIHIDTNEISPSGDDSSSNNEDNGEQDEMTGEGASSRGNHEVFASTGNWPLPSKHDDQALGMQANGLEPPPYTEVDYRMRNHRPPPAYSTLPPLAEKFYSEFNDLKNYITEENEACTLFGKLRQMTGIIRYIETTLTRLRKETGVNSAVCADDLIDVIILILCNLDSELLLKLYAHMNLMIHLSPKFMQGNAHEYALVTLNVAYQHLFEQSVMYKSSKN